MKIGMILESKFPPDIRVEKEVRALISSGHEIHLLAMKKDNQPIHENSIGIHIHRIVELPNHKLLISKLQKAYHDISHYDHRWYQAIRSMVQEYYIDALHVHDLPLVATAVKSGAKEGIPVVADLHENYPAAMKAWKGNTLSKIVTLLARWESHERKILKKCNRIIVVVQEAETRIIESGIDPKKIHIVSNTEDINYFQNINTDQNLLSHYSKYFNISYIGGFSSHRGIDTAIRAMPIICKKIPNARLLLVGGKDNDESFKKIIDELDLANYVELIGWQDFDKVATYITLSAVCLVPHKKNPHTDATIPHKLFQYMLLKKPVIVSNCTPLKRIVEETKAGLVFTANDSSSLAQAVLEIHQDSDNYGNNGYQAVINKYNWQRDGNNLTELYNNIQDD